MEIDGIKWYWRINKELNGIAGIDHVSIEVNVDMLET